MASIQEITPYPYDLTERILVMPNYLRWIRGAAVGLATLGIVIPHSPTLAADSQAVSRPSVRSTDARVLDIALSKGGTFTGRIVDHTGAPLEGAEVTVKQGQTEIARSIADRSGTFTFGKLKGGIYAFSSGATSGSYRVWPENAAPPSANPQGLLIMGQNGTRGQFAAVDATGNLLIGLIAVTGLVVGLLTLKEIHEVENKIPHSP